MLDRHPDLDYALGEVINIQTELEQYFGDKGPGPNLIERLEGVEARLAELADTLYEYVDDAATMPHHATGMAKQRLLRLLGRD